MRFAVLFLVVASINSPKARATVCKDLSIHDTRLPIYPVIARAAHMEGIIRFNIHLTDLGIAQVQFLDGPSKGAFGMLLSNAQDYANGRQYGWVIGGHHDPCNYTLAVEYKIIGPEVPAPNNFLRVTVIDPEHTLVEAKPTVPTVNY